MNKKTNLSDFNPQSLPDATTYRIGIVAAEWNAPITDALLQGARSTLLDQGVLPDNLVIVRVPGTFELTTGCDLLLSTQHLDAVIGIGCVIQGETRHFDFICQAVSNGLTQLTLKHERPVIFSVLTTNNVEQAQERAGGNHGNKGVEGAVTALKMIALSRQLNPHRS